MNRIISILLVLLGAQITLALITGLGGPTLAVSKPDTPLLTFDREKADRIRIEGPDEQQVELVREEQNWVLPDYFNAPASSAKVDILLDRITGLRKGWPVTTTAGSIERFKVGQDNFEYRISLAQGHDNLASLYLGSSPGLRQIHVRPQNEDAVYAVAFASHEAPVKAEDWIDTELLALRNDSIQQIVFGGLSLVRDEETWFLDNLDEQQRLNQEKARELANKLASLRYRKILATDAKPEFGQEQPVLQLTVSLADDKALEYIISKPDEGDAYVLKRSDLPWYFELAEFQITSFIELAAKDQLIEQPESQTESRQEHNARSEAVTKNPGNVPDNNIAPDS